MNSVPVDTTRLLAVLHPALRALEDDLAARASDPGVATALAAEWQTEVDARRTADPLTVWTERRVGQIAAAWLLTVLFVRTLEDKGYAPPRLKGGASARESFRRLFPYLTDRDYLRATFRGLSHHAVVRDVFDAAHNPVWTLGPSADAATALVELAGNPTTGLAAFDFSADTRFLGDVYEKLNEQVRKRYALLQTPDFVEDYLLANSLDPAIEARGTGVTLIDPTCGSGHLLLGAFRRLLAAKLERGEGPVDVAAFAAIHQVYGADLNPYAVGIARFRLVLAYLDAIGADSLDAGDDLRLNLAVADSLLPPEGADQQELAGSVDASQRELWRGNPFALAQGGGAARVLGRRFDVVVGNPPYITVKDKARRDHYRKFYVSTYREYQLVVPFVERFFGLASEAGWVAAIVGNGFMKREFGRKLIEEYLPTQDLTAVIDTSGAFIPGHGTPTAILLGRHRRPSGAPIRCVMGKRGEPSTPAEPSRGVVWSSIRNHGDSIDHDDDYVTVAEVSPSKLATHPWSLRGGGASQLKDHLEETGHQTLGRISDSIGFMCITKQDEVFALPAATLRRWGANPDARPFGIGQDVRDWSVVPSLHAIFPYDASINALPLSELSLGTQRLLFRSRRVLEDRKVFGGATYRETGRPWWTFGQIPADRFATPLSIAFAFVATHNHFVLDRGGKVFKQSAPIIKLPPDATEDDHLALLGYLNSSTACFWMKQVFFNKQSGTGSRQPDPAKFRYEFAGTQMAELPLPDLAQWGSTLAEYARELTSLAESRASLATSYRDAPVASASELRNHLSDAQREDGRIERRCVALQEELDWTVYAAFGLADSPEPPEPGFETPLGGRAFEVRSARNGRQIGTDRQTLCVQADKVIESRLQAIDKSRMLRLLEDERWKRRWRTTPKTLPAGTALTIQHLIDYDLTAFLLDALESALQRSPRPRSLRLLAHRLARDPKVLAVAQVLTDSDDPDLTKLFTELALTDAVPYLAAWRFKPTGMTKWAAWNTTWDAQRREDAGEDVTVPLPPKYGSGDFRKPAYWKLRGKLDVPKERFILYTRCQPDDDDSPILGWAGWNHAERMDALYNVFSKLRQSKGREALIPAVAGLHELLPWVIQWHGDEDPMGIGQGLGSIWSDRLDKVRDDLGLSLDDLAAWRPRKPRLEPARLLAAVDALDGAATQRELVERLGASNAAVKKAIAALVDGGALMLVKNRPRTWGRQTS